MVWVGIFIFVLILLIGTLAVVVSSVASVLEILAEIIRDISDWVKNISRRFLVDKSRSLRERNVELINSFLRSEFQSESELNGAVNNTLNCIMIKEGRRDLIYIHQNSSPKWNAALWGMKEWCELRTYLWQTASERLAVRQEEQRLKNIEEELAAQSEIDTFWNRNVTFFSAFLDSAERASVSIDAYGDKTVDEAVLEKEIERCFEKLSKRIGASLKADTVPSSFKESGSENQEFVLCEWEIQNFLEERFRANLRKSHTRPSDFVSIDAMSGVQFEVWIADALKEEGFVKVRGTQTSGDQGADLLAEKDGRKIVIQAKRHKANVGNAAVQEIASAVAFYHADEGWVIASSYFTKSAIQLAKSCSIRLIDRNKVLHPDRWLESRD